MVSMKRLLCGFLILFSIVSLASKLKPEGAQLAGKPEGTFKVEVNLVNVFCTVTDKSNRFVTNLGKDDFKVFEDGKPQEIRNFNRETNLPLKLGLLIDTSESVLRKLEFEQDVATSFFQSILKEKDRALLAEFDSSVTLLQDFTNDVNKLTREIRSLRAGGGTSLHDAIYLICEQKFLNEKGRKAIIIISDGMDTTSRYTFNDALEMARRAEAIVFAISTNKSGFFGGGNKTGDKVLTQLAQETGGKVFFPFKADDLNKVFHEIAEELRSQYSIGYVPSNISRNGNYRNIVVKIANNRGLRVRHRRGYYPPSE